MNGITIFNNPQFGEIRTAGTADKPLFCLADVCKALGLTAKIVNQRLGDEVVSKYPITDSLGREQQALFVNEDGLYDVILDSRKPEAKAFRRWITGEVLPSIRRHGAYMTDGAIERTLTDPDYLIRLATTLKDERKKRLEAENKLHEAHPKIVFADAVSVSKNAILIFDLAKILKQNGVEIGGRRLFDKLREEGFLIKSGSSKNMPTQRAMDLGLFVIKEGSYINGQGVNVTTKTTKVTGKGQLYFINKFLSGDLKKAE